MLSQGHKKVRFHRASKEKGATKQASGLDSAESPHPLTLGDKACNDTVKEETVIETGSHQLKDALHVVGSNVGQGLDDHRATLHFHIYGIVFVQACACELRACKQQHEQNPPGHDGLCRKCLRREQGGDSVCLEKPTEEHEGRVAADRAGGKWRAKARACQDAGLVSRCLSGVLVEFLAFLQPGRSVDVFPRSGRRGIMTTSETPAETPAIG